VTWAVAAIDDFGISSIDIILSSSLSVAICDFRFDVQAIEDVHDVIDTSVHRIVPAITITIITTIAATVAAIIAVIIFFHLLVFSIIIHPLLIQGCTCANTPQSLQHIQHITGLPPPRQQSQAGEFFHPSIPAQHNVYSTTTIMNNKRAYNHE
jgi:hypothetical protein